MLVFLFTDIESSTQLWEQYGARMGEGLSRHDAILQHTIEAHGGTVVKNTGDGVFAVFDEAGTPLQCAIDAQRQLAQVDWGEMEAIEVRMALHAGEAESRDNDYFGSAVNRTARLLTAGWGGQILLSEELAQALPLPPHATLQDFGTHLLKDLGQPQRIYGLLHPALGQQTFPPLRSLSTQVHNLPPQPTPFINRKREMEDISARLDTPACRLLTLTGSGGIGKTRLAVQVGAKKIESFAHGVFLVPLAPLTSPDFIVSTIGDALRFPFSGRDEPKIQLFNYLREKQALLILDNFEHLVDAAGLIAEILDNAPRVKILVTSRERLNLRGEWSYELRGMEVPLPKNRRNGIEKYSAVQLFLQNAHRVNPSFALSSEEKPHVAHICDLVEGIPLGIELASAWVRALSCAEIAQEIEQSRDFLATSAPDVPQRHQSLRAIFENSWRLLTEQERQVVQQLAVFRGGFRRQAAEEVAGATLPLLLALVDKSLIRRTASGRYEMLETLRQYALEKLVEDPAGETAALNRHCTHFTALLKRRKKDLKGGQQAEALAEIEAEIENVRAAWRRAIGQEQLTHLGDAIKGLFHFYEIRGWFQEGMQLFQQALDFLRGLEPSRQQATVLGLALSRQGWFAYRLGRFEEAEQHLETSLDTFRRLEIPSEAAFALYNLGILSYQLGHYETATRYLEESLRIRRAIDNRFGIARSLSILGIVARDMGDKGAARRLLQESLAIHREIEDQRGISRCLNLLALIDRDLGDNEEARQLLQESLDICRAIEDRRGVAFALNLLGTIAYEMGEPEEMQRLVQESLDIRTEIGDQRGIAFSLNDLGSAALGLGAYDEAKAYFRHALRVAMDIQAIPLALYILTGIARLRNRAGREKNAHYLATLVLNHPSSFEMARTRAQQILDELGAEGETAPAGVAPDQFEAVVDDILNAV